MVVLNFVVYELKHNTRVLYFATRSVVLSVKIYSALSGL